MNKIFWLTGLPCSGKTTIGKELARRLYAELLDGDDIREFMKNTDFSPEGRERHMLSVAEIANRFSKHVPVVVALVSPIKSVRDAIKAKYPNVIEVFVKCNLEECEKRDVKGMYKKARAGEIKNFTGVDAEYEKPGDAVDIMIDTESLDLKFCVDFIIEKALKPEKYCLFIGRWQPLHKGHKKLFDVVREEGKKLLIGIRNTEISETDPYSVDERIRMIRNQVPDAEILVLPDIEAVVFGRKVGYEIRELKLDEQTEAISATAIRAEENGQQEEKSDKSD